MIWVIVAMALLQAVTLSILRIHKRRIELLEHAVFGWSSKEDE